MYVPISGKERDYMNRTGEIPQNVRAMSQGCAVYTPEQRKQVEKERDMAAIQASQRALEEADREQEFIATVLYMAFSKPLPPIPEE